MEHCQVRRVKQVWQPELTGKSKRVLRQYFLVQRAGGSLAAEPVAGGRGKKQWRKTTSGWKKSLPISPTLSPSYSP